MTKDKDSTTLQEYFISGIVVLFFGLLYLFLSDDFQFGSSKDNVLPTLTVAQTASHTPTHLNEESVNDNTPQTALNDAVSKKPIHVAEKQPTSQEKVEVKNTLPNESNGIASQQITTTDVISTEANEASSQIENTQNEATPSPSTKDELQPNQEQTVTEIETSPNEEIATADLDTTTPITAENEKAEDSSTLTPEEIAVDPNALRFTLPDGSNVEISNDGFDNHFKQAIINGDVEKPIIFDRVYFDSDSSKLKKQSDHQISATAALLHTYKEIRIAIRGHSDNLGSSQNNSVLSLLRSRSMKKALTDLGIKPSRIQIEGIGNQEPIASNKTKRGRRSNRRIDLIIKK
jgi:outer membrane protein OmpA-like peptidoglycan-associated protein